MSAHCSPLAFVVGALLLIASATAHKERGTSATIHQKRFSDAACTQLIDMQRIPNNACLTHPADNASTLKYVCEQSDATKSSRKDGNDYGGFTINTFASPGCKGAITNSQWYYCDAGCNPYYECKADHVDAWSDCGNYHCSPCTSKTILPLNESCLSTTGTTQIVGYSPGPVTVKRYLFKAEHKDCTSTSIANNDHAAGFVVRQSGACFFDEVSQSYATLSCA